MRLRVAVKRWDNARNSGPYSWTSQQTRRVRRLIRHFSSSRRSTDSAKLCCLSRTKHRKWVLKTYHHWHDMSVQKAWCLHKRFFHPDRITTVGRCRFALFVIGSIPINCHHYHSSQSPFVLLSWQDSPQNHSLTRKDEKEKQTDKTRATHTTIICRTWKGFCQIRLWPGFVIKLVYPSYNHGLNILKSRLQSWIALLSTLIEPTLLENYNLSLGLS